MGLKKIDFEVGAWAMYSGLRKTADAPCPCLDPEHDPPGNIVLPPGMYEYVCPGCGTKVTFSVPMMTC